MTCPEINDSGRHPFDSPSSPITASNVEQELAYIRGCRVALEAYLIEGALDTTVWLKALVELRSLKSELGDLVDEVVRVLAPKLPYDPFIVEGLGMVNKRKRKDRTQWQTEDLLRAVLDSRRANEDGELVDETQMEKVLHCWNLGAPRVTALRERKINADEYAHVEDRGYDIRIEGAK